MSLRVAITGSAGQLGRQLDAAFRAAGDETLPLVRPAFDLADATTLAVVAAWKPDVVVNAAAWTDVDGCARDPARAMTMNGEGAGAVAAAAAAAGALAVQVSTNEVFDGALDRPYLEDDPPAPINPYGESKALGERLTAAAAPRHVIVRTAWLFGPGGANFVTKILAAGERARAAGGSLRVVSDEWGNPTATPWLASAIVALLRAASRDDRELGIHHLAGQPPTSRLEWARRILAGTGTEIQPITLAEYQRDSRVPPRAVLGSSRQTAEPTHDWQSATDALVADILGVPT
jgi:dTDP-4-dehydrorhamnose reductase